MCTLFITDSLELYTRSTSPNKLFYKDCYIQEQSGFDASKIDKFNYTCSSTIEFKAAQKVNDELENTLPQIPLSLFRPNKYVAMRQSKDQVYTYFYSYFQQYVQAKHIFILMLDQFLITFSKELKIDKIELNLVEELGLVEAALLLKFPAVQFQFTFRSALVKKGLKAVLKEMVKPFAYIVYSKLFDLKFKQPARRKHQLLLITFDVPSDSLLLKNFFELVKKSPDDTSLIIIQVASGIEKQYRFSFKKFEAENIKNFAFEEFRKHVSLGKNNSFFKKLKKEIPVFKLLNENEYWNTFEMHHEWMQRLFEKVKPTVCFYTNQGEMGRVLSEVARYNQVPSVCIEYSLTLDSPFVKANIDFTARACINHETAQIFKKNDDPTRNHLVIGYCKHDLLDEKKINKADFFKAHNLNPECKTVLFASTWSAANKIFNIEKAEIIAELAEMCHKNKWNLIIKKHPSEFEKIAEEVLNKYAYKGQKVFAHEQLPLADAVSLCDFMCCQSSSAILEALLFQKPFAFISLSKTDSLVDMLFEGKEDKLLKFHSMNETETFLNALFYNEEAKVKIYKKLLELRHEMLYLADGKACNRLLGFSKVLDKDGNIDAETLVTLQIET